MLSKWIEGSRRYLDQDRLIRASGLFDEAWYAERYPDGAAARDRIAHFLKTGAAKGYDPSPRFSSRAYLADHPDVRSAGTNPLLHYLWYGYGEGRSIRNGEGQLSGPVERELGADSTARMHAAFDADFYRATNPHLPEETDPFAHFMTQGWRERRDPAPWFSTSDYLRRHGDVAQKGENPFVHYVEQGCEEGRAIAASARRPMEDTPPRQAAPRCAALAMIRNEADIIAFFTSHVLALFDDLVIVDHGSDDGTAEFLADLAARDPRVELLRLDVPAYVQSLTMTHLMRAYPGLRDADWLFFLDADEFLPFEDRTAFHASLAPFQGCAVLSMPWQNLIPKRYWTGPVDIAAETEFLITTRPSQYRKIALQPARLDLDQVVVAQGNHAMLHCARGLELPDFDSGFPLLHLPIRSIAQIEQKLAQGVQAYQTFGAARDKSEGSHWDRMYAAIANKALTPDHLNALADHYSEKKPDLVPLSTEELEGLGYEPRCFSLACSGSDDWTEPKQRRPRLEHPPEIAAPVLALRQEGTTLVAVPQEAEYPRLPDRPEAQPDLAEVIARTFAVPSVATAPDQWAPHLPLLQALMRLARPRRALELDTEAGSGALALAAAMGEPMGQVLSCWAAPKDHAAFEDYRSQARPFGPRLAALRKPGGEARAHFADQSLDLLILSGFDQTNDALKHFDNWRATLAPNAILLIPGYDRPDIAPLWQRLQAENLSLTFPHGGGLGLVAFGDNTTCEISALISAAHRDPDLAALIQNHFASLGSEYADLARRRADDRRRAFAAALQAGRAEEISQLQQNLATTEAEAAMLRGLLKDRPRHAS